MQERHPTRRVLRTLDLPRPRQLHGRVAQQVAEGPARHELADEEGHAVIRAGPEEPASSACVLHSRVRVGSLPACVLLVSLRACVLPA